MSKKNAQEKTSRAPVCAILCAIFFALAAVSSYALFDGGKLHSIVRGLGEACGLCCRLYGCGREFGFFRPRGEIEFRWPGPLETRR